MPTKQSWYEIKAENAARKRATDVYVYDEIGRYAISGAMFASALQAIDTPVINLYVNSPGGQVDHGKAIYNALKRHPARVVATVDGMAASIASLIVQAADDRIMADGASMMIHEPYVLALGDTATLQQAIDYLNVEGDAIAEIYAARAGGTGEEWRTRMKKGETWYGPQDAVDAGLADRATNAESKPAAALSPMFNLSMFKNVPEWVKNATQTHDPAPQVPVDIDHGWPFLAHHDATGAVDAQTLRVALARVKDLNIPIRNRAEALRHLNGHAAIAARAA